MLIVLHVSSIRGIEKWKIKASAISCLKRQVTQLQLPLKEGVTFQMYLFFVHFMTVYMIM